MVRFVQHIQKTVAWILGADSVIDWYWHEWCKEWCRDEPLKISQIAIAELLQQRITP